MEIKLIKKQESYLGKEDGKLHNCYGIYVVVNGIEVKVQPVFKNYRSLLGLVATLVEDNEDNK